MFSSNRHHITPSVFMLNLLSGCSSTTIYDCIKQKIFNFVVYVNKITQTYLFLMQFAE